MRSDAAHNERILRTLAAGQQVTQRSLARDLGVALGLTNLLIRRLASKGYVRIVRLRSRHVRYLLTSKGRRALAAATRVSMQNTVHLYTETKTAIRATLDVVARRCSTTSRPEVVFYGAGNVAEIAYVSLQSTGLGLIAVVDDFRTGLFFDVPISSPTALVDPAGPLGEAQILVASVRRAHEIRRRLESLGVPAARVSYVDPVMLDDKAGVLAETSGPLAGPPPVR